MRSAARVQVIRAVLPPLCSRTTVFDIDLDSRVCNHAPMTDFSGENNPRYKHGLTDGGSFRHPVYTAWQNMKSRCLNQNNAKYHRYGGRGVKICSEWMDSAGFAKWAFSNGWSEGLTLDRKDNDGDYEPSNCHWITKPKNSRKKSTTKLTYRQAREIEQRKQNGEPTSLLAAEFGVSLSTVNFICCNLTWRDLECPDHSPTQWN